MLLIDVSGNADGGLFFCLFLKMFYLFLWLYWVLVASIWESLVVVAGALLPCGEWDLSSLTKDGSHIP